MDNPTRTAARRLLDARSRKNLDVHYSSGVGNHFFYLLAEGSGAEDHRRHGPQLADLQRLDGDRHRPRRGREIWFRALTVYMTSGTTYAQARTATLNAATDLFGAGSAQRRRGRRRLERGQRQLTGPTLTQASLKRDPGRPPLETEPAAGRLHQCNPRGTAGPGSLPA